MSTLWYLLPDGWDIAVSCCLCSLSYRQGVTCHSLQIHRGPVSAPVPSRSCFMHPGNLCLLLLQVLCNIPPEPFLQGCHKIRRFPISVGRVCPPPPLALLHHAASPALIFGTEHPRVLALSLRQATLISAATQGGCGDRQPLQKHPASAIKRNTDSKTEEVQQNRAISWLGGGVWGERWAGWGGHTGWGGEGDTGV